MLQSILTQAVMIHGMDHTRPSALFQASKKLCLTNSAWGWWPMRLTLNTGCAHEIFAKVVDLQTMHYPSIDRRPNSTFGDICHLFKPLLNVCNQLSYSILQKKKNARKIWFFAPFLLKTLFIFAFSRPVWAELWANQVRWQYTWNHTWTNQLECL